MRTTSTVVYIEDDNEDWELFGHVLQELDLQMNILHLHDGQQGLTYLLEGKAKNKLPALVIVDLNMPKINGMELIHLMQQDQVLKEVPTVVFSTSTKEKHELAKKGIQLIEKPGDIQAFTRELKTLFQKMKIITPPTF